MEGNMAVSERSGVSVLSPAPKNRWLKRSLLL